MPNHVRNTLTIVGPARDIATFVMRSHTPRPPTGDKPGTINYTAEAQPDRVPFDLHGVVPLPTRYSEVPYSPEGYDMEVATWGVKWGAYSLDPQTDIQIAEHRATYSFTTAWGPPTTYYLMASQAFPRCTLLVSYGGEGPCLGRQIYRGGAQVEAEETETIPCPDSPDDWEDEEAADAYDEAYHAYETQYLATHDAWVDAMLEVAP